MSPPYMRAVSNYVSHRGAHNSLMTWVDPEQFFRGMKPFQLSLFGEPPQVNIHQITLTTANGNLPFAPLENTVSSDYARVDGIEAVGVNC